ncbi:MAG: NAD(P)H-binding protein [Crocinitomicaceae bacterium]|nr:NAD(P)H-binding protein [Crocinitomicaceae bacterium]
MKITVIGASGGVGLAVVKRALQRNHTVTGISRSAVQLIGYENFTFLRGDALKTLVLKKAIENADAVLVTLGTEKNKRKTTLFSEFATALVNIHNETKANIPFIFVTGFGTGESQEYVSSWFIKLFLKYMMREVYIDKAKMEEIISASEMNWTIVRPGRLLDEPLTEKYRIETELYSGMNITGINRADIADYMVKQAENQSELKKYVAISAQ